jgi:YVTN family beta-propeller protein
MSRREQDIVPFGVIAVSLASIACTPASWADWSPPIGTAPTRQGPTPPATRGGGSSSPGNAASQSGSIALSSDGLLYVAANDNGGVSVVDPKNGPVNFIPTGTRPEHLIIRGSSVYVSNRQSRSVTQIDTTTQKVVRQIAVGAEPMGMDLTSDGLLLVACAMSGTVQAIDMNGNTTWTVQFGEDVRAVAVGPHDRAYAPSYKSAVVHVIDTRAGMEISPAIDMSITDFPTYQVRGVESIVYDSVRGIAFVPHTESRGGPIGEIVAGETTVSGGYSQPTPDGSGSSAPITVTTVTTVNPQTAQAVSDPLGLFFGLAGPKVAAINPATDNLYVVSFLGSAVASNPFGQIFHVGAGPNGIAISGDGTTAYVYNSFEHTISVLDLVPGEASELRVIPEIEPQTLSVNQQNGRLLFNSSVDSRMSAQGGGGVACASCHPDGRDDGHTWQFPEGLRNTPTLVGRALASTAPYHWDGQIDGPAGFSMVVQVRMGGSGIAPSDFDDIFLWLENEPAPDNPNRSGDAKPTADQIAGSAVFISAGCSVCHSGPTFTDNAFHDVGTGFTTAPLATLQSGNIPQSDVTASVPNTPSLLGVFASAPYLHDGSKATLRDRITQNPGDMHGTTSNLTNAQVDQLVAYLQTL